MPDREKESDYPEGVQGDLAGGGIRPLQQGGLSQALSRSRTYRNDENRETGGGREEGGGTDYITYNLIVID